MLEETEVGYRLRLGGHRREEAVAFGTAAFFGLGMGLLIALVMIFLAAAAEVGVAAPWIRGAGAWIVSALVFTGGALTGLVGAARLSGWLAESEQRMEHIASWTRNLLSTPPKEDVP